MADSILEILTQAPSTSFTARALAQQLHWEKTRVNQVLYELLRDQRVIRIEGRPPQWQAVGDGDLITDDPPLVVVNDLGNVHDIARPIKPYVEAKEVEWWGFADLMYQGYPLNDPVFQPFIIRATVAHKNAADLELVTWVLHRLWSHPPDQAAHLVLATKDAGLLYLKEIVTRQFPQVQMAIVKSWDELKHWVE